MAIFTRPQVVLCTSPSGNGRDAYLNEFQSILTTPQRRLVRVVPLRDKIFEVYRNHGVSTGDLEVLDLEDATRNSYRSQAIQSIASGWKKPGCFILSTPHPIMWKGAEKEGISLADVQNLNPDMFVTIIDDVGRVKETLRTDPQFQNQHNSIKDLAVWRASAIKDASDLASARKKPFYVIPRDHPPEVLRDLIFHPKKARAYFSFPITNMKKKGIAQAKRFVDQLRTRYTVFDPLTIQDHALIRAAGNARKKHKRTFSKRIRYRTGNFEFTGSVKEIADATETFDSQVVERDFKLIDQSDLVIVYYPIKALAAGVISEMFHAHYTMSKRVYAWHPHAPSPFFKYFCTDRRVFAQLSKFRKFLNRRGTYTAGKSSWEL